jgi:phosphatidylinositol glycan class M
MKETYAPNLSNIILYGYYFRMIFILIPAFWHIAYLPTFSSHEYVVMTDAARLIYRGESPFQRHTFRHSPLLSLLMVFNLKYWHGVGKLFYCMCDIITALLLRNVLRKTVELDNNKI